MCVSLPELFGVKEGTQVCGHAMLAIYQLNDIPVLNYFNKIMTKQAKVSHMSSSCMAKVKGSK